jgi:hypothetical protein
MTTFQKYLKYKNKYINYNMKGGMIDEERELVLADFDKKHKQDARARARAIEQIEKEKKYTVKAIRTTSASRIVDSIIDIFMKRPTSYQTLFYIEEIDEHVDFGYLPDQDIMNLGEPEKDRSKLRKAYLKFAHDLSIKMRSEFLSFIKEDLEKDKLTRKKTINISDETKQKIINISDDLINFARLQIAVYKDELRKIVKNFLDLNEITDPYIQGRIIDKIIEERRNRSIYTE